MLVNISIVMISNVFFYISSIKKKQLKENYDCTYKILPNPINYYFFIISKASLCFFCLISVEICIPILLYFVSSAICNL